MFVSDQVNYFVLLWCYGVWTAQRSCNALTICSRSACTDNSTDGSGDTLEAISELHHHFGIFLFSQFNYDGNMVKRV